MSCDSSSLYVLGETNHYLVAWKEAGILSQADSSDDIDMLALVKDYIKDTYQKPGNVYVGLVNRLDQPVSGVMVFGKSSKGASRLSDSIRAHSFKKTYLAFATGSIQEDARWVNYLVKSDQRAYESKVGKESILSFKVIKEDTILGQKGTWVLINLETGRYQQIRCQFSLHHHPLLGDKKYGYDGPKSDIYLSCISLTFPDPITKEDVTYTHLPDWAPQDLEL